MPPLSDLLAGIGRQIEDGDRQQCDQDARYDQVDSVEESLAADVKRERHRRSLVSYRRPRLRAELRRTPDDIPRSRVDVVAQVNLRTIT